MVSTYNKPHLSFQQQLKLLKARGLEVTDDDAALAYLNRIGYYRLSAYCYPLLLTLITQDPVTHCQALSDKSQQFKNSKTIKLSYNVAQLRDKITGRIL